MAPWVGERLFVECKRPTDGSGLFLLRRMSSAESPRRVNCHLVLCRANWKPTSKETSSSASLKEAIVRQALAVGSTRSSPVMLWQQRLRHGNYRNTHSS